MLKQQVARGELGKVILMDSITKVSNEDKGQVVVSGSHGGSSSGEFALGVPLKAVFFNDAGVGKESAGIAALQMLQEHAIAGGTVSHLSARIGDSQDMWDHGVISHLNDAARALGLVENQRLDQALIRLINA